MSDLELGLAHPTWRDYVDHHDGDTTHALMRLEQLMIMDMSTAMPDERTRIDVSSMFDSETIEECVETADFEGVAEFIVATERNNE